MQRHARAQRNTLTYAQMYGGMSHAGMMEGKGIFSKIGKFFKKAFKKVKKFVKKRKVISRLTGLAAPIVGALPIPGARVASGALGITSFLAKQKGFGLPAKIKSISRTQVEAILRGLGSLTSTGGLSLAAAKYLFPKIKNLTATQMKALAAFRGRHMKGGGISLAGGGASGLPMSGMGFSGQGVSLAGGRRALRRGAGIKLAGQGLALAGGDHNKTKRVVLTDKVGAAKQLKKRVIRRPVRKLPQRVVF